MTDQRVPDRFATVEVYDGDAALYAQPRLDFLGEVERFAFRLLGGAFQFGNHELAQPFTTGE